MLYEVLRKFMCIQHVATYLSTNQSTHPPIYLPRKKKDDVILLRLA